jgi:hypothetical protein
VNGWEDHYKEKSFLYQCKVPQPLPPPPSSSPLSLLDSFRSPIRRECVGRDQPMLRSSPSLCCHRPRHLLHPWRHSPPCGGPRERHPGHLKYAQCRRYQPLLRTRDRGDPTGVTPLTAPPRLFSPPPPPSPCSLSFPPVSDRL